MNFPERTATQTLIQIQREYWEHKRVIHNTFITLSIILLITASFFLSQVMTGHIASFEFQDQALTLPTSSLGLTETAYEQLSLLFDKVTRLTTLGYWLISLFLTVSILVSCLCDDRKDKSILFWKSMPVSELKNVCCKWLFAAVILPVAATIMGYAMSLVLSMLLMVAISQYSDLSLLSLIPLVSSPLTLVIYIGMAMAMSIWLSPLSTYLIAISAYAKKNPLVLSIFAPLIIIFFEKLFRGDSIIVNFILWIFPEDHSFEPMAALFSQNAFPVIITSAAFMSIAVWMRNNYYEH